MTPSPRVIAWAFTCLVVVLALITVMSFLSDPFGIRSWFEDRKEQRLDHAESNASARALESQGNAEQVQRVETFHRQEVVLRGLTEQSINEARSAPDATDRPSPEYADALRAGDERLCQHYAHCEAPEAGRP